MRRQLEQGTPPMKSGFSGQIPQKSTPAGCRNGQFRSTAQAGFTLMEILIAVMIMSLLTILILSGVQNVRTRAKIQFCQNNLRELGMAFDMYDTFWEGKLPPSTGPDDDDLRPLYPLCVKSFELFICIDTANWIETADHLAHTAGSRTSGPGHSYEYLSYYLYDSRGNLLPTPIQKTRSNVDVRADKCWLLMDSMQSGIPNKPDMTDNHYESGGNVLFADSHVEWIEQGRWEVDFQHGNAK